jgi:cell division protein FtsB
LISIAEYEKKIDQMKRSNEELKAHLEKLKNVADRELSEVTKERGVDAE